MVFWPVQWSFYRRGMQNSSTWAEPELVVSGRIRTSDGAWGRGEVWLGGGRILRLVEGDPSDGHVRTAPEGVERAIPRLDVGNAFVLPGVVDAHVHCLSYEGEGVAAATRAAGAGGVTTIVEMPFDVNGPIDSHDRLLAKQELIDQEAHVDVALLGTLSPAGGWREAEELASLGVVGFKVSLFLTDPHRFPRIDDHELRKVMRAVHETGRTLCVHAENNEVVKGLIAEESQAHPMDPLAHGRSRPVVSETLGALTALEIAAEQGTALHLCHLSASRGVDLAGWYQGQGVDATVETCPHYLTFEDRDMCDHGGRLKINPPLRSAAERDAMWRRVADGAVTVIASDHAPWPLGFKDHDRIFDNHSGVPGVETLVAATLGGALRQDETLTAFGRAADALTISPARRFGLADRKGSLEVGKDADLTVFVGSDEHQIDETMLHSNAGWSPYDGLRPGGYVSHTISRGQVIWDAASGAASAPGRGQLMTRSDRG